MEDVPSLLELPKSEFNNLIHIRSIASLAYSSASVISKFQKVKVNTDHVVAAALIADMSKMLEWRSVGRVPETTKMGKMLPHAFYAAMVALDAGLPIEIVHLILTHSRQSQLAPKTLEGIILYYADQVDTEAFRLRSGLKTIVGRKTVSLPLS